MGRLPDGPGPGRRVVLQISLYGSRSTPGREPSGYPAPFGEREGLRIAGAVAAISGSAAVALPWTTGTGGPTVALEQLGYALHLPIMIWCGALGWRYLLPA
ncbi:hypothetical protein DQ384_07800 [Sphaerisporangium album]|uniref:Uncharacterized protein n=1 Tax=Sphaerisporangium album TaxID=509200 RepID=A0A367FNS1_9ACTN|nr:hypothetical protein DQ384_07800 [Sphaerisporangium album]